jgi:hypothetical protein
MMMPFSVKFGMMGFVAKGVIVEHMGEKIGSGW